jgi:hypothetical protein
MKRFLCAAALALAPVACGRVQEKPTGNDPAPAPVASGDTDKRAAHFPTWPPITPDDKKKATNDPAAAPVVPADKEKKAANDPAPAPLRRPRRRSRRPCRMRTARTTRPCSSRATRR